MHRVPALRTRLIGTAFVVCALAMAVAVMTGPPTQAADRAVTLSKSTNVGNGEVITVSWTGFAPNTPAYVHQCEAGSTSWRFCSEFTRQVGFTGADGSGSVQFPVWGGQLPSLNIPGFGNDPPACFGRQCEIFVSECSFDLYGPRTAKAGIQLTAQGANPSTTTSTAPSTTTTTAPVPPQIDKPPIAASGSSAALLAMEEWQNAVIQEPFKIDLGYTELNSPSGAADFVSGASDFAVSGAPLDDAQKQALKDQGRGYAYVPIALNGTALVLGMKVNGIPVTDFQISPETMAKTYNGASSFFNDPIYTADNGGCRMPSSSSGPRYPLPVIRTDQSAANLRFTGWMHDRAPADWPSDPNILLPVDDSRLVGRTGDRAVSELVAFGVPDGSGPEADRANSFKAGRLAYVDRSWALTYGLTMVRVKNTSGAYVAPTDEAVLKGLAATKKDADGFRSSDFGATDPGVYPLVNVVYAIVPTTLTDSFTAEKSAVLREFLTYAVSDAGQAAARKHGFVPLPADVVTEAKASIAKLPGAPAPEEPPPTEEVPPGDESGFGDETFFEEDFSTFDEGFVDEGFAEEVPFDESAASDLGTGGGDAAVVDPGAIESPEADGAAGGAAEANEEQPASKTVVAAVLTAATSVLSLPFLIAVGLIALAVGPVLRIRAAQKAGR